MPNSDPLARVARFESGQYRPVTFLQRGIAMPFTTPHLLGGRIRPGERGQPELLLGNPVGEDGVYILPWSALPEICTPTLHDRALAARVAALTRLSPRRIRDVARQVAAEGFAGRPAARAAEAAVAEDFQARTRLHYHLLLELVRQGEASGGAVGLPAEQDSLRVLEQRARAVLVLLEPGDRTASIAAYEALAEVAEAFSLIGLPGCPVATPVPALVAGVDRLMQELTAWVASRPASEQACVRLIGQSAELTLRCCRQALAEAHAVILGLADLLRRWRPAPGLPGRDRATRDLTVRPEWLLDGWALICGLWRTADPARRGVALLDMVAMVPVMPAEAGDWLDFDAGQAIEGLRGGLQRWRRMVQPNQDWMTGRMLDLIARNEVLRAAGA